jgi:hypothetical protein
MAIKKSDLHSSLWASFDELRGGMDASQYKDCHRQRTGHLQNPTHMRGCPFLG